jgi:hypothetical protein
MHVLPCIRPIGTTLLPAGVIVVLALLAGTAHSQRRADPARLADFARDARTHVIAKQTALYHRLRASTDPAQVALNRAPGLEMMFINRRGVPVYYIAENQNAAKTVRTWDVWPVGVGGGFFGVTGETTVPGELAVWDSGRVVSDHAEFGGRVTQMDVPTRNSQHATHVSGTLIAGGVNPSARGMSYQAPLHAYDWRFDTAEMAVAAAGNLQISSHSYAHASGWEGNRWYGDISVSQNEDYGFGFYDEDAQAIDEVAYLAPEYLIVLAAGNDRNDFYFSPHYHWDNAAEAWVWASDSHGTDYQNGGYDTIPWFSTAKNALLVGAVDDIPGGYSDPSSIVMMPFSNWGPCDDGRIKPDIVANGFALTSIDTILGAYITFTGTSMAAPNAAGSINLIAQEFKSAFGHRALSSTLKAIVINTADAAGASEGPDYSNGWGLLNTHRAIELVHSNEPDDRGVLEAAIPDSETDTYPFVVDSAGPLRVTIAWTDPPGTPPAPGVDPPNKMLINDLDVRITALPGNVTTLPWSLDRLNPAAAPLRADNSTDNVEQIDIASAEPGNYVVTVTHKGALAGGTQDYALVWRGATPGSPTGVPATTPAFRLDAPVPHPVGARATINFHLDRDEAVTIRVYDVRGRVVKTLLEKNPHAAGAGMVEMDATGLSSGVYFLRMDTASRTVSRKITIVR